MRAGQKVVVVCLSGLLLLALTGCASASPIDYIWPAPVPFQSEAYLQHEVPSIGGITTLAIVKGVRMEIEWRHTMNKVQYSIASQSASVVIEASESLRDGALVGLAALGLGGAPLAWLAGSKKKRPQDFTKEELETAGNMEPDEFKKA